MSESKQPEAPGSTGVITRRNGRDTEAILFELESRHAELRAELAKVEARLREVRTAADLCPECGGSGLRWTRGGLYGEAQQRPCPCGKG